jgi:tripartite-type tricarboxylate transporter receptor subunit TctC
MSAPKGMPPETIDILNKAVNEAQNDPKLVARLADLGGAPKPLTPDGYGRLIADATKNGARWSGSRACRWTRLPSRRRNTATKRIGGNP